MNDSKGGARAWRLLRCLNMVPRAFNQVLSVAVYLTLPGHLKHASPDSLDAAVPNDPWAVSGFEAADAELGKHEAAAAEGETSSQSQKIEKTKRVHGTPIQALQHEFKKSQKEREVRLMSLLERLVTAIESQCGKN
ncbi:hypothetical protein MRX96_050326 [Rhipicephalus microplus]